ncbi:MFS general substrate transporter [Basidiobolus meristosporus CBS 931.73]|uniref:MFS general substrate transporter n=1 Tax=Basidiobolus meristosporus CBS 931.73 TaxID=1314790 RepID=A0A1Y1Y519_9FUNG|nr:MFS general substrate transporter [Basidiobolus meristosporus CBS 931.73]ORX93088.1 MFS general substrate transporter [Basidiobolus meristosporus CBS 931.73]|eukprot:ORX93087.1 MFS general substrate transporter [Basidiobolus meristosporus CBS 931.73]
MRYNSPLTQVLLVGLVCFCCPGMFNVINGMGAGGQMDDNTAKNGNVALYACFAVFGCLGGGFYNVLGGRLCMLLGGLSYALYSGSLLNYNVNKNAAFVIASSAVLGIGAGILWTTQGVIMMAYPAEDQKGRCVGLFWIIFNLGGVMGAFIPFGLNFHSDSGAVSNSTYLAFLVIMVIGAIAGLAILPPAKVVRDDGSRVHVEKFSNIGNEIIGILKMFTDKNMLLLTPLCLASNWFYSYQFGAVNGVLFNLRSRSFNNAFYWGSQMAGAYILGAFLDTPRFGRRTRALYGLAGVGILFTATWGGGLALQLQYTREDHPKDIDFINDAGAFWPKWVLYVCYGICDAALQTYAYWIMGAMSNDSTILARYAGYYKGMQSAGAAIAWRIDAVNTSFLIQLIVSWALFTVSLPFTYLIAKNVKETCNDTDTKMEEAS